MFIVRELRQEIVEETDVPIMLLEGPLNRGLRTCGAGLDGAPARGVPSACQPRRPAPPFARVETGNAGSHCRR